MWEGVCILLFIGLVVVLIDLFIGVVWGSISGYCGGCMDEIMMCVVDILYGVFYFLFVIILMVMFG